MPVYEGSTVEEAITNGLQKLNLSKDEVEINIISEAKKGFMGFGKKAAQVSIEPTVSEQITEAVSATIEDVLEVEAEIKETEEVIQSLDADTHVRSESKTLENLDDETAITELSLYLTMITKELNAPADVRVEHKEIELIFHLETEKPGVLIGKHGKILNALQYLAQVFVHRAAKNKLSVVVNVGNYREKRQLILQKLAERTAEKVKATGRPVFLEPMPAFERKQIHYTLNQDSVIQTHSEGDEPHRYLVVEPAQRKN